MIKITNTNISYISEPLKAPFGFKGGYVDSLWNVVAKVESEEKYGIGLGLQSVLWSDANVFSSNTPEAGNKLMFEISKYAIELIKGMSFNTPMDLMSEIFDNVYEYGKKITGNPDLRKTFALNALVPVDNALWQLYGREKNTENFLDLIDDEYKDALANKADKLCNIPLVTYNMTIDDVKKLVDDGFFFLKIKTKELFQL